MIVNYRGNNLGGIKNTLMGNDIFFIIDKHMVLHILGKDLLKKKI